MKNLIVTIALVLAVTTSALAQRSDAALRRVTAADRASRDANGELIKISAAEHLERADVYSSNRLFPQAREHWQKVLDEYPGDPGTPKALFGTARSYMWERQYEKAVEWFNRLTKDFLNTKDGREGLAFTGASLVRLGRNIEAAKTYEQYTVMFPEGERIESAHLNIIDAYREAKRYDDANRWVEATVTKFAGKPTEANALHAKLRMEIHRGNWKAAAAAADRLLNGRSFAGTMTSTDEVKYLKAFALECDGKRADANSVYGSIPRSIKSYYSGLAADRAGAGSSMLGNAATRYYSDYPVVYRTELLKHAAEKKVDPRFVLAIMKQESSFRADAKSPAAARGLLQLVFDTAVKYNERAGYPDLKPDDLYRPEVNIAIGMTYIADLKDEFDGLYEAVAASYNGGEDNAARWLARSKPKTPAIFASEVGFAETKDYVFKVMNNYRIYRELYTENLTRR